LTLGLVSADARAETTRVAIGGAGIAASAALPLFTLVDGRWGCCAGAQSEKAELLSNRESFAGVYVVKIRDAERLPLAARYSTAATTAKVIGPTLLSPAAPAGLFLATR
jgi:hypothetical protein